MFRFYGSPVRDEWEDDKISVIGFVFMALCIGAMLGLFGVFFWYLLQGLVI